MKGKSLAWVVAVAVCAGGALWMYHGASSTGNDQSQPARAVVPAPDVAAGAVGQGAAATPAAGLHDTGLMKPPAGAKVAVYEFDDLECPYCAHALPLVHAAAERYKIPLVHRDFPLTEIHQWSFDAAVTARYLEDKVSPRLVESFRADVFAHQNIIASEDDLGQYTGRWFQAHNLIQPFVMDPACRNEVVADRAFGERMGIHSTPCIFVVTQQGSVLVTDVAQLDRMIETALSETADVRVYRGVKTRLV